METKKYNGFTNKQTWNVALWINNKYFDISKKANTYSEFLKLTEGIRGKQTPDGISWESKELDIQELDETIKENI